MNDFQRMAYRLLEQGSLMKIFTGPLSYSDKWTFVRDFGLVVSDLKFNFEESIENAASAFSSLAGYASRVSRKDWRLDGYEAYISQRNFIRLMKEVSDKIEKAGDLFVEGMDVLYDFSRDVEDEFKKESVEGGRDGRRGGRLLKEQEGPVYLIDAVEMAHELGRWSWEVSERVERLRGMLKKVRESLDRNRLTEVERALDKLDRSVEIADNVSAILFSSLPSDEDLGVVFR